LRKHRTRRVSRRGGWMLIHANDARGLFDRFFKVSCLRESSRGERAADTRELGADGTPDVDFLKIVSRAPAGRYYRRACQEREGCAAHPQAGEWHGRGDGARGPALDRRASRRPSVPVNPQARRNTITLCAPCPPLVPGLCPGRHATYPGGSARRRGGRYGSRWATAVAIRFISRDYGHRPSGLSPPGLIEAYRPRPALSPPGIAVIWSVVAFSDG
jgi:hypothetical protein